MKMHFLLNVVIKAIGGFLSRVVPVVFFGIIIIAIRISCTHMVKKYNFKFFFESWVNKPPHFFIATKSMCKNHWLVSLSKDGNIITLYYFTHKNGKKRIFLLLLICFKKVFLLNPISISFS